MSYSGTPQVELGFFKFSFSGNLTTNDYVNITVEDNNISGSSITGSNTLNLPAGDYLLKCFVGASRTSGSDVLEFQIESDGTLVDVEGSHLSLNVVSSTYETTSDHAYAQISKTASNSIKVKVTNCTASSWTVDSDYSYFLVIRSF